MAADRSWEAREVARGGLPALVASGTIGYAAHEGGKIRHPEIRGDGTAPPRERHID